MKKSLPIGKCLRATWHENSSLRVRKEPLRIEVLFMEACCFRCLSCAALDHLLYPLSE